MSQSPACERLRVESTLADLAADLESLGIRAGDVLIVHSSMKRIGRVSSGPETVVAALQQAVSPGGTIVMPTFSYNFERVYSPVEPYDPKATPSKVGLISETFRKSEGVLRSDHPTHSVAAWGRLARDIAAAGGSRGRRAESDLTPGRPFRVAASHGAKVLMVGCDFTSLSLLHAAEEIAESPYLPIFNWSHLGWKPSVVVKDARGQAKCLAYANVPGCSRNFGVAETLAKRRGMLCEGRLGEARVVVFDAQAMLDLVAAQLRRRPAFLLCAPGTCPACDDRHAVFEHSVPGAAELGRFMIDVVARCGCRPAGSPGEDRAADMIAQRMADVGLANVRTLRFPIQAWQPGFSTFRVLSRGKWEAIESTPVVHSPSTGGKTLEGRSVHVESFADLDKVPDRRGAIAVLWDGYGESLEEFRRLMGAGFGAMILVDKRFTHDDLVAAGVPASWVPNFRTPMITVPHPQAVRWFGRGPVACRLQVGGRVVPGRSTVVLGEIPGREPGVILLSGHHDTTPNSAAPDDNLSGVALAIQVGMLLARKRLRPRLTLRFCSFGAEEQLSEGARWYAFESGEAGQVRFVVNSDGAGSRCGTTGIYVTGGRDLADWVRGEARRSPLQFKILEEVCPFSDQFPLNCRGAPSLWFYRETIAAGRHYHHTVRDTFREISFDHLARVAEFQAGLVEKLARREAFPFRAQLPAKLKRAIAAARKKWFG